MTVQDNNIAKDISILELMISKITRYFNNSLALSDLIYDLESYLNQIAAIDNTWKKNLEQHG